MGSRGPIPLDPKIASLMGARQRKPGLKIPPKAPSMPVFLGPAARREWRRVVPELERLGIIGELDRAALACYCSSVGQVAEAEAILRREGTTYTTPRGVTRPHPAVRIRRQAEQQVKVWSAELGLTPAARRRLGVIEPDEENDLAEFLDG